MALGTVVIVNDYSSVNGGAAKVAIDSACALTELGWKVHFFAAVGPVDARLLDAGVEVTLTDQPDLSMQTPLQGVTVGLWNRKAAEAFVDLLDHVSPASTVIHLHGWVKALTGSVVRAAIDSGNPVTMTLHDYFLACPNGGLFNFRTQSQCQLKPMSAECMITQCDKRGYHQKVWRLVRQAGSRAQGIPQELRSFIAVSHYSKELLEPYVSPLAAIDVIDNPITNTKCAATEPAKSSQLLYVGRLDPEKGVVLLARAAREAGMKVRFVGAGPEEAQIRESNPEAELVGWLSSEDVVRELRAARALILPSLWHETQGMVVAEAAAHGIPAVVPNRCAAAEMITDRGNGLIFRSGDLESLKHTLIELKDDLLVANLGDRAYRQFWENPPTIERHARQLSEHYQRLLKRPVHDQPVNHRWEKVITPAG